MLREFDDGSFSITQKPVGDTRLFFGPLETTLDALAEKGFQLEVLGWKNREFKFRHFAKLKVHLIKESQKFTVGKRLLQELMSEGFSLSSVVREGHQFTGNAIQQLNALDLKKGERSLKDRDTWELLRELQSRFPVPPPDPDKVMIGNTTVTEYVNNLLHDRKTNENLHNPLRATGAPGRGFRGDYRSFHPVLLLRGRDDCPIRRGHPLSIHHEQCRGSGVALAGLHSR